MNDFTKEELVIIFGCVDLFTEDSQKREEVYLPIINKIQSMIDNYDAQVIEVWHCEKCGHVQ